MHIYKITNIKNKKIYIGQTIEPPLARWENHKYHLKTNTHHNVHLQRAWKKYGDDSFQFEIICEANSKEELNKLEENWIKQVSKNSYNIRPGGSKSHHTNETRRKVSISLKRYFKEHPEVRERIRESKVGLKATDETKQRMRDSHKRGSSHHNSVLTEKKVLSIREQYIPRKIGLLTLARKFGVDKRTVLNIIHRKTWSHI